MSLAIHHDSQARQFEAELSGQRAVLAYRLDNAVMSIEHIAVPAPIDGQGVAAALMEAALAQARARGWQVDPVCPYARDIMRQHPGYAELLRNSIPASEHAAPEGAASMKFCPPRLNWCMGQGARSA